MDMDSLTVSDCIRMFEKEKKHVVLHAGKVTDMDISCNKGIQENTTVSCMPSEQ
ncbi:MAG: hypothetical protein HFH67_08755 [Lachnospiraceae bacterium]|nr:hypothetical protein [Lachnospiraceae bacterium]